MYVGEARRANRNDQQNNRVLPETASLPPIYTYSIANTMHVVVVVIVAVVVVVVVIVVAAVIVLGW